MREVFEFIIHILSCSLIAAVGYGIPGFLAVKLGPLWWLSGIVTVPITRDLLDSLNDII